MARPTRFLLVIGLTLAGRALDAQDPLTEPPV